VNKALLVASAVCIAALPLLAQRSNDPDKNVAGGGSLPAGWTGRVDEGASLAGVKMMLTGQSIHFMTGPAGVYFRSAEKPIGGAYEAHATFTQLGPAAHPEAYGLFIGGSNLNGANQKYTYFLVRQDGKFIIKRRAGNDTPTIADWTDHAAIKKADASGKMTNTVGVDVGKDKVRFLVNGTEVSSADASQVDTNGVAGLRINHNLNVMVDGFTVKTR
jgi:hypothetical protein